MEDNQRQKTMRKRIGEKASNLVNNSAYLPRVRRVQMDTTPEEFDAICNLAMSADNPQHYFMKMIAKDKISGTLDYVRRLLKRSVEAISYVARKIGNKTKSFLNFIGDKISEYPMNQVVDMVDYATTKKQPDRYLVGILKKGYILPKKV